MWWKDSKYNDEDGTFTDYLKQLIDMGHLEEAALGITEDVIKSGLNSLSNEQKRVFKKYVIDQFTVSNCKRCNDEITWIEMYDAANEHGECSSCVYNDLRKNKF